MATETEIEAAYTIEVCPGCGRQEPHPHGKYRWQCRCGLLLCVDADEAAAGAHYRQTQTIAVVPLDRVRADDARDGWVKLDDVVHWLRHIDRLDEIPGAKAGMPRFNPLWDAANALEAGFSGGAEDTRPQDEDHEAVAQAHRAAAYGGTWMRLPDDEYDAIGRAYLCAERDRVAELEAVIAIGRCNVCGERLSTESVQDRIDRAVTERTADLTARLESLADESHGRYRGNEASSLRIAASTLRREFLAPTRTQEASDGL